MAPKGRFAPSPSGRMHLGNVYAALISWLSIKSRGGTWLLRIEDLDPQRSKAEYARQIEDDLLWLGLEWDEGGLENLGNAGPYSQSLRGEFYQEALRQLADAGLTYPCYCTRADIMATQAPHESDGRIVYAGTCRNRTDRPDSTGATRLIVPDSNIKFNDRIFGPQSVNLSHHCGDFVLRRADGAWAYQLAVVVDDALMGVTEVVRGADLLLSAAQQIYLYDLLGYKAPEFAHFPLMCNLAGQRLAKRDASLSLAVLRRKYRAPELIGRLAAILGIIPEAQLCTPSELISEYSDFRMCPMQAVTVDPDLF